MKRIVSLDDLCLFCEQNKLDDFEAENDTVLAVNIPASFSFTREIDSVELAPVTIKACHDDINKNRSNIDIEVIKEAADSFKNRPILAEIIEKDDGDFDFGVHAFQKDEDGNVIFTERPVGIIPESCNPRVEYDEDKKKNYLYVDGYIYESYGNQTMEILDRRGGNVDVSIEIGITKFSYDRKKKILDIQEFVFLGVTLLGEDVRPAMEGAHLEVADFELKINKNEQTKFSANNDEPQKGGFEMNKEKISELMAKYSITELPFADEELSGKSDEELETLFAEKFKVAEGDEYEEDDEDEPEDGEDLEDEDDEEDEEHYSYSVTLGKETFSSTLPLNDKIAALNSLVNKVYRADDTWYSTLVYDNELVMLNCWGDSGQKGYRQAYEEKADGTYALVGERVEVFATWLTKEEQAEAEKMRTEYTQKLEREVQTAKDAILNDESYSVMSESAEWKELVKNVDTFSVDELNVRAAALFGNFCKAQNNKNQKSAVQISIKRSNRKTPYGSLF